MCIRDRVYIGLGKLDQAFEWLEKSLQDRSWWLAWLKVDPLFDRARSDPRFSSLMSRVGLPSALSIGNNGT